MARYTLSNQFPAGTPDHRFVGWDSLGEPATEATNADFLGMFMPDYMVRAFKKLEPGERLTLPSGNSLFREY